MKSRYASVVLVVAIVLLGAFFLWQRPANAPTPDHENTMDNSAMLNSEPLYKVKTEEPAYFNTTKGFFAHPQEAGSYPGVVMVHEWWGLNDNIKDMARQLAGQGYNVLAVDLYNGEVASTSDRALQLVQGLDQATATKNLKAATSFLRAHNATKLASLGWCFGGGQSLQLALSGEPLDATIIYYGQLTDDKTKLAALKWPVLGIFGDQDTSVTPASVDAFQKAINDLHIQNEIHIYPGVGHAFANPSGANYAPEATKDAWAKTLEFLQRNLK